MLTSWYNGPGDLEWMAAWRHSEVPRAYAAGYRLHLIVYSGDAEGPVPTSHGQACGRAYPLSDRFPDDMRRLARIFAGPAGGLGLYVSLFTEFQTYPCTDNAWNADPTATAYYRALKDRYRSTQALFHQVAPNARVSLSWGGWQARWDDPPPGPGGRCSGTSPTCSAPPTSRASRPWRPTPTPPTSGPWSGPSGPTGR